MDRRDSTDNELIIDEGDGNGIENSNEEEAVVTNNAGENTSYSIVLNETTESEIVETPLEPEASALNGVEPEPQTVINVHKPDVENNTISRLSIKSKSSKSKHQSAKPKKALISPQSKSKYRRILSFKLSSLKNFKTTTLSISTSLKDFYNMRLYITPGNVLSAQIPTDQAHFPMQLELNLEQLLNWPGLTTALTLRDITIVRKVLPNYARDIVFGDDQYINVDKVDNVITKRRISKTSSNKPGPLISKEMCDTYLAAFEDMIDLVDISRLRIPELKTVLNKLKNDLQDLPNLYLKTWYSYYPNQKRYMRIFNKEKSKNTPKTYIREIMNPEVQFSIERCTFTSESIDTWEQEIYNYFEKVFIEKDRVALNAVKDTSNKWITFTCMCNSQFSGALSIYSLNAHLAKHFFEKDWRCIECEKSISQFNLAENGWIHECGMQSDKN